MALTMEQNQALDKIHQWMKSGDNWCFKLGGFAGTGKTYLLQHLINLQCYPTLCCAPTGKAASVLKSKLNNIMVTTIHKLICRPHEPDKSKVQEAQAALENDPNNTELKIKLDQAQAEYDESEVEFSLSYNEDELFGKLIIVDESSMVTEQLMNFLRSTGCKVLFVGDPGQLPPVKSRDWFKGQFDVVLQSVQRQAQDSPIIRLSMDIREGRFDARNYQYKYCRIVPKSQIKTIELVKADQIITGKHITRRRLNRMVRKKLGYESELPVKGDKIICGKNEYLPEITFINGVQCEALTDTNHNQFTSLSGKAEISHCTMGVKYDEFELKKVPFDYFECLRNYRNDIKKRPWWELKEMREFDYGYAVTCHKAQGSEWDHVVIIDDKMRVHDFEQRKRWLYTAVTRAKERLTMSY